jgi:hypothetical protein
MSTLRRNRTGRFTTLMAALALFWTIVPHGLWAQDHHSFRSVAYLAGPANYDLSGTGWSWSAAARLDLPLGRLLVLEPGLGFFTYSSQFFGTRSSFLLPEVSLQLQYPGRRVRPYLGVGGGGALLVQGIGATEPSVHGTVGLRVGMTPAWGVRGEARVRNLSVFEANNSIFEFLAGLSGHF